MGTKVRVTIGFHIVISVIGLISVILHILYSPDPVVSMTKFTIHSNVIVVATFLYSCFVLLSRKEKGSLVDYLKNCSLIYMTVNILTYHFILSRGGEYEGVRIITNFTLHYLIPILVYFNWLVFEKKRRYNYKFIIYWMSYPLLYTVVTMVRGLIDGFYPYFFFNPHGEIPVGVGSYGKVALFMSAFFLVFILLGFLLITLNKIALFVQDQTSKAKKINVT